MATKPAQLELYDEIAGTPRRAQTGYAYADLQAFPVDNVRRELIEGELIVTASPIKRHQQLVGRLHVLIYHYAEKHGGEVYVAPRDVYFTDHDVVEPDLVFMGPDRLGADESPFVRGAPTLVIEVSSPSTRRLELIRKHDLYERFGVPEYWYVDLDADRIEVYRLQSGGYPAPLLLGRGESLASPQLPGLSASVDDLLGPIED